jgi:two-component system, chemotaxis family, chemotaxis protein CheY
MSEAPCQRKSVLIIDDDRGICEMLELLLEDEGYQTVTAYNGMDALMRLQSETKPCIILLDLNMPIMTGWEFRHEQKNDPAIAEIPVAVISADRSIQQQPFSIDAVDYFRKPVDVERLLSLLDDVC